MSYKIVRFYFNRGDTLLFLTPNMITPSDRTVKRGLTLEEAQAHCNDPETSSSTCTSAEGVERTEKFGPWFEGYEKE